MLRSVLSLELLGGNHAQSAVEVVDTVNKVLGELLDGKVASSLNLTLGAILEVSEVGDSSEAFILKIKGQLRDQRLIAIRD